MTGQSIEVWAQLILDPEDRDRIVTTIRESFGLREAAFVKRMHMTVYHGRRPLPGLQSSSEAASVAVSAADFRFMVMAPGGENPRPGLVPSQNKIGVRLHRQSSSREEVESYRARLTELETERVLGARAPSTKKRSAFGARHFQPHMTLLRSGNGAPDDLKPLGEVFRSKLGTLRFTEFLIDVVRKGR